MSDIEKLQELHEAATAWAKLDANYPKALLDEYVLACNRLRDAIASLDISRIAAAVEFSEAYVADEKAVDLFRRDKFDTEEQMNEATTILCAAHEKKYAALAAYRAARGMLKRDEWRNLDKGERHE